MRLPLWSLIMPGRAAGALRKYSATRQDRRRHATHLGPKKISKKLREIQRLSAFIDAAHCYPTLSRLKGVNGSDILPSFSVVRALA